MNSSNMKQKESKFILLQTKNKEKKYLRRQKKSVVL